MRFRPVANLVGWLLVTLGAALLICCVTSWRLGDPAASIRALAVGGGLALAAGGPMALSARHPGELTRREGFGVVVFGWLAAAAIGAVPFRLSGVIPTWTSAFFETMSGFTTTGASVIASPESVPRGLLLWRALTQFFGGMGVLVLVVALLPLVGTGGMQLFRAEMPGPTKDRLTPRIADTAKRLWAVYALLAVSETILLRAAGLPWFDAVCHSFTTVSTGGFSTRAASIRAFNSPAVEWIVIAFMFLGGTNFALHYRGLTGRFDAYRRDSEFKLYLLLVAAASLVLAGVLRVSGVVATTGAAIRHASFAATTIATTTGFSTEDFGYWPAVAQMILFLLMFVGSCAGSTTGSIKVVRVLIALRMVGREIYRWMQPDAVMSIKVDRHAVDKPLLVNVLIFIVLYLLAFAVGTLAMSFHFQHDWISAASSVAACLGNIGPGFGAVGPSMNYASVPAAGQMLLSFLMLLGRLELFTVVVLFVPACWRR